MLQKSPGGSVFPYYYKGGEIHALKYGGFGENEAGLFSLMEKETAFIRRRPAARLRVWVDFYETKISDDVCRRFISQIGGLQTQLVRLAVVGLDSREQRKLNKLMKNCDPPVPVPLRFFEDPEDAKTWLVGGRMQNEPE